MATITIPYETLRKFDLAVQEDGGNAYRSWLGKVLPHMTDAYRQDEEGFRSHLGASIVGHECPRDVWYTFRWAYKSDFDGRMLRLFNRGHLEEGRMIALLLSIGAQVFQQDANGKQFRISWAEGHAGGSGDGVVTGIAELGEGQYALLEFKTHGEKSFEVLAGKIKDWRDHLWNPKKNPFTGKGVREAKFEHYVQMQIYMKKMGIPVAMYVAVNKNTDDIYSELVYLNSEVAEQFLDRGSKLVYLDKPPRKMSESPGHYKCRFCNSFSVCHGGKAPARNCRTCVFSEPRATGDAVWFCTKHQSEIGKEVQLVGCNEYSVKKDM